MNKTILKNRNYFNILKVKLFVSIHIFKAILQAKNSFKKPYNTIKLNEVLKSIIQLSYAMSKQC